MKAADAIPSGEKTEKSDRRVQRTRSALRNALAGLIREKGYSSVTVEEITQRAGVGRATFYLHYRDKEDLLLEHLMDLARDRVKLLAEIPLDGWDIEANPPYPAFLLLFQNAAENAPLFRVVLHGEGSMLVTQRLRDIIRVALDTVIQPHEEQEGGLSLSTSIPLDFLASYLAGALVGSIGWWLEQDSGLDAVEMTRTFQRMFFPGAGRVFGFPRQ
jgi:AcrR family transcriptional regulator